MQKERLRPGLQASDRLAHDKFPPPFGGFGQRDRRLQWRQPDVSKINI
jgi:hypothetical protein